MVQIIAGEKGKGKTKILIDRVNEAVVHANGSIVYLDKSNKNMYELNTKIRLINVKDYLIDSSDEFMGFICGIISQDHDLEKVFLDSFLKLANIEEIDVLSTLTKLNKISEKFSIDFIVSLSINADKLPKEFENSIVAAL